jgi:hypothetical protein
MLFRVYVTESDLNVRTLISNCINLLDDYVIPLEQEPMLRHLFPVL